MRHHYSMQSEIGPLMFELTRCINDLHCFSSLLSLDDLQQADLCLQKLNALISHIKKRSYFLAQS